MNLVTSGSSSHASHVEAHAVGKSKPAHVAEAEARVQEIASPILERTRSAEPIQRESLTAEHLMEGLNAATLVFIDRIGKKTETSSEVSVKDRQELVKLASSLSSSDIAQIKDVSLQSALAMAKQAASHMKEALIGADPTTSRGRELIQNIVAFAAVLNAHSIAANELAGDSSWNVATIASTYSEGATLSFALNTCATTLGIAVSATDMASLAIQMLHLREFDRKASVIEKRLSTEELSPLERQELKKELDSCRQEKEKIRSKHFSADNLTDKFLTVGANSTYFASNWMAFAGQSQVVVGAVGSVAFGAFLTAQGAKGIYSDVQLYRTNQKEIKGLEIASQKIESSSASSKVKSCAQNLIKLKLDHSQKAEKTRRILSFIKNVSTVLTGIASTGVLGGPIGLAVCLSLNLAIRLVEAIVNHKPQIQAFFTSLPALWGGAKDHPRSRLQAASKEIKTAQMEIQTLNRQMQEYLKDGKYDRISILQIRVQRATQTLTRAQDDKAKAQVELNQAKLAYFISKESQQELQDLSTQLKGVSADPKALGEFKQLIQEQMGIELSGSYENMYNQLADFITSSPRADSALAKLAS